MDLAAVFADRLGDVGVECVEKVEKPLLAQSLRDRGRGPQVDEQQGAFLAPRLVIAPGGEGEENAGAEQIVDGENEIAADAGAKREDDVGAVERTDRCGAVDERNGERVSPVATTT